MKVIIGNTEYKTIKECTEQVRTKINKMYLDGELEVNRDNPNFNFIMDILNNHPSKIQKIGVGINSFLLTLNAMTKRGIAIFIKRLDDSEEDFSWLICTGAKKISIHSLQLEVMRDAIKTLTINFKMKQNELNCALCGINSLNYHQYHVDHKTKPFVIIANQFINENSEIMPTWFGHNITHGGHVFEKKDKEIEQKWYDYHLQHSDFQILCNSCNSKKGKKLNYIN